MFTQIGFGVILLFVAVWLYRLQRKIERTMVPDVPGEHRPGSHDDPATAVRRKKRRTIVSLMIGVVGVGMVVGALIQSVLAFMILWLSVIGVVIGITWLGFVDLISTRQHVRELRQRHRDEHDRLKAEVSAAIEDLRQRRED